MFASLVVADVLACCRGSCGGCGGGCGHAVVVAVGIFVLFVAGAGLRTERLNERLKSVDVVVIGSWPVLLVTLLLRPLIQLLFWLWLLLRLVLCERKHVL